MVLFFFSYYFMYMQDVMKKRIDYYIIVFGFDG